MAKPEKPPPSVIIGPDVERVAGVDLHQYMRIGQVVALWSTLETVMQETLWNILGVPVEDGRVITQRTDATRKLQWLRTFAKRHVTSEQQAELAPILEEIESLQDDRNFIAHGTWFTTKPDGVQWAASIRAKSLPDEIIAEAFPDARLVSIIERITNARKVLARWGAALVASRGKSPAPPPPG